MIIAAFRQNGLSYAIMLRELIKILIIGLCCFPAMGFSQPWKSPSFIHIDTRQGLSQSHVSHIIKDHKGFMWFATDAGLNRYDGYRFRVFKHQNNNPSSISNNLITDIVQQDDRYIWIATGSGLDRYDYQLETFTHFNTGKETLACSILKDSKNRIWVGTIVGFFLVNPVTGKFTPIPLQSKNNSTFNSWLIHDMVEDAQGKFWLATNRGLVIFDPATGKSSAYDGPVASGVEELLGNWVRAIHIDQKGKIWIGSIGRGVACFDPGTQQFSLYQHVEGQKNGLVHNDILSFEEDASGQMWIGTENGGISIWNPKNGQFQTIANDPFDPHSLSNNSVYVIYRDDLGNMWVGTWSGGVNLMPAVGERMAYVPYVPGKPDGLNNASILSISSIDDRTIWVGTDGGGLNALDWNSMQITHYMAEPGSATSIKDNYVIVVHPIDSNVLGLGYQREGLDLFDTRTKKVVRHLTIKQRASDPIDFSVNTMFKDRHNRLWVGTWGAGVMVFDQQYRKVAQYLHSNSDSNSIINDFVNCIIEDHNGVFWFGTEEGLGSYDPAKRIFQSYQHQNTDRKTILHNQVNDVMEDEKGNIWLVSTGGLNKIDPTRKNIFSYQQEVGQMGNSMMSILEDHQGILWIGTYTGLTSFNPTTETFKSYVGGERLRGQEFKNNSAYRAGNGYLFLGGTNGFNFFHPDSLKENKFLPDVRFTGFRLFNQEQQPGVEGSVLDKSISSTDTIVLNYKQNVFTIDFAALGYVFPENNQYAYLLESFDKDWIFCGQNRSATYTNLNPGKYVFKVKASNNDGVWNEKVTSILIIVRPPFWQTLGFKILIFLAFIGAMLGFARYRVASYHKQKVLLEDQVKQQTNKLLLANEEESKAREEAEKAKAAVEESNQKLQMTNQEMEHLVYIVSHDLKEPLRTTTSFIELLDRKHKDQLDEKAHQYLHFITDACNRMKNMIDDLLDYSRIGKTNPRVMVDVNEILQNVLSDLEATIQEQGAVVSFGPMPSLYGYATELKLLFQNIISNAIKFRKKEVAPQIRIQATDQKSHWLFSFQDNGIGIDPEYHEKIFQLFQRLHLRTEYDGTGIGLAHCQKIVALHEGKIWVDSSPGEGSTFHFTISKTPHQSPTG